MNATRSAASKIAAPDTSPKRNIRRLGRSPTSFGPRETAGLRPSLRLLALLLLLAGAARAAEEPPFREARFEKGQLRLIEGLPVLIVEGTPAEIGTQQAALTGEAAKKLAEYPKEFFKRLGKEDQWSVAVERAKALLPQIPADHRREMDAFAERSGIDRDLGLVANTLCDGYRGSFACSSLMVDAERSATGGPLFGRNLDFFTLGMLARYTLVTVQRPKDKHAFASVGFPGLFGVLSGMNDAGLAVAVHEVLATRDGSPPFNPKGVPYTFAFRRVLEECSTVAEAEKLLSDVPRTTRLNLAVCDRRAAAAFEMTPKTFAVRRGEDGLCACTNHFRTKDLAVFFWCRRYNALTKAGRLGTLSIDDVAKKLHEVNQGSMTVQTMIFEPARLRLHLACGSCPASALPLKVVELKPLLEQ